MFTSSEFQYVRAWHAMYFRENNNGGNNGGLLPYLQNVNISTTTVPMTTKLGRLVIYYEELLLIKPHDSLIMWSSKITWQTKTVISPLSLCPATNLLAIKSYDPLIAWSCKIMWQTKTIISPLPQWIWQSNWVQWWFTLRGSYQCYSIWLFYQLVLWDPMTN